MISVVIPIYKNTEQLVQNLRRNLPFFKDCEVILVNDDPSKSIKNELSQFKQIKLYENEKNLGFGQNVNKGVSYATGDYLLFLNTDVALIDNSFKNAVNHFNKDPNLFGVSFAQIERNGSIVGKNKLLWARGFFFHSKAPDMKTGANAWAEGGTALIDKNKFLKLGGFDSLYTPFYWEDTDISYRAWKSGYNVLFDADIKMEHHHEGTIGQYFMKRSTKVTANRNQFIFIWKNITDTSLLLTHFALLVPNIFYYIILKHELNFLEGFIQAVKRLPTILSHRKQQKKMYKLSDRVILSRLK
jgi:GT2 family glycosyltransferase